MTKPATTIIWCVTDDKPGHKSQLTGLVNALSALTPVTCQWFSIHDQAHWAAQRELPPPGFSKHSPNYPGKPTLILTAGSGTHWPALKLRWRFGGKLIVLMNPSLPRFLFDLCIIPEHDGVAESQRVVTTKGAINPVTPSTQTSPAKGLILIGGPSKHYDWSNEALIEHLRILLSSNAEAEWTLTTSRRTPPELLKLLQQSSDNILSALNIVPLEDTDAEWLAQHYRECGTIWITEDSVSMIYESLSSGAATGIIRTPRLRNNRVSMGVDRLIAEGRVSQLSSEGIRPASKPAIALQEAERVANIIIQRLL